MTADRSTGVPGSPDAVESEPPGRSGSLQWVRRAFAGDAWDDAQMRSGAFHDVAVAVDAVARVLSGPGHRVRAESEHETWTAWNRVSLPLAVPSLIGAVVSDDDHSGYLVGRLPGEPCEDLPWRSVRARFAEILSALAEVDVRALRLPPPRAWCGGEMFGEIVSTELAPQLARHGGAALAASAIETVDRMLALGDGHQRLVHGDLGPHNLLWHDGDASGLIDLDHSCVGDVMVDLAPLIGRYGSRAVREIATREDVERATTYRATLSLQVAAAAHLRDAAALCDHALGNFATRMREGSLGDPDAVR